MDMKSVLLGAAFGAIIAFLLGFAIKSFGKNQLINVAVGAWGGLAGAVIAAAVNGVTTNLVVVFGLAAIVTIASMFAVKKMASVA